MAGEKPITQSTEDLNQKSEQNNNQDFTLSREQKEIYALRKKLDSIKAGEKVVGQHESSLRTRLLKDGDPKDAEYRLLAQEVKNLQKELQSLQKQDENIKSELNKLSNDVQTEIQKLSTHEVALLQNITNAEFLKIPKEKRLQYVTKKHIDGEMVTNNTQMEFSFDMDGDGIINNDLLGLTTAGQVLPAGVRVVEVNGVQWTRRGIEGEFFSHANERLCIYNNTNLQVKKFLAPSEFPTHPHIDGTEGTKEYEISKGALKYGIQPKFLKILLQEKYDTFPQEEQGYQIELYATQIARVLGEYRLDASYTTGDYTDETALRLFYNLDKENYEKNAKAYGIENVKSRAEMSEYLNFSSVEGLKDIAQNLDVDEKILQAIFMIETGGKGLGKAMPRFESHKYDQFIKDGKPENESRMLATSYGAFQVMGFNFKKAGYKSVQAFVSAMTGANAKEEQLKAFENFINTTPGLVDAMKKNPPDYDTIARLYNGNGYKKYAIQNKLEENYAQKLKRYYE